MIRTSLLAAGLLLAAATQVVAQTPPKVETAKPPAKAPAKAAVKPAAKPAVAPSAAAAETKPNALGGGTRTGALLTREELRACLSQEESIRKRLADVEASRAPLDREKETIAVDQAMLRTERGAVDDVKKEVDALAARMRDYGTRVESWNQRVADFNAANKPGTQADRQREELNRERQTLQDQQKELEAEKARLASSGDAAVKAFNAKATALDARVSDWNGRNAQWNETSKDLEVERKSWVTTCADRRYREEDELAIRNGK